MRAPRWLVRPHTPTLILLELNAQPGMTGAGLRMLMPERMHSGTMYIGLRRMEEQGLITSTPIGTDDGRRSYHVTPAGRIYLSLMLDETSPNWVVVSQIAALGTLFLMAILWFVPETRSTDIYIGLSLWSGIAIYSSYMELTCG